MASTPPIRTTWFTTFDERPAAALRLFCFPYAGAATPIFRPWSRALPDEVELYAAQLPGRWQRLRDPPIVRMSPLVRALHDVIVPLCDRPYAMFGHSMGAMIAFELARALRESGRRLPCRLFVSGRRAPHLPKDAPPLYDLPDEALIRELERMNGTPRALLDDPELMAMCLPPLRADLAVCDTYDYVPAAPLDCPITAFGGAEDVEVDRERLDAWRAHTNRAFRRCELPGDHFFVHGAEKLLLAMLADELRQVIDDLRSPEEKGDR